MCEIKLYTNDGLYVNRSENGDRIVRIYDMHYSVYGSFYRNQWYSINCIKLEVFIQNVQIYLRLKYGYYSEKQRDFRSYKDLRIADCRIKKEHIDNFKEKEAEMLEYGKMLANQLGLSFLEVVDDFDNNKHEIKSIESK